MPLPETLRDPLAAARSMISRADGFDLALRAGNAKAMLANARAFVVEDAAISDAFDRATQRIDAMQAPNELERSRTSALRAIDFLEHALGRARPNTYAMALGADWF